MFASLARIFQRRRTPGSAVLLPETRPRVDSPRVLTCEDLAVLGVLAATQDELDSRLAERPELAPYFMSLRADDVRLARHQLFGDLLRSCHEESTSLGH